MTPEWHNAAVSSDRWQRLKGIIGTALQMAPGAREAYLREACAGDDTLLEEATSLLDAGERAEPFLERAVEAAAGSWATESSRIGLRLGPYELVRELGQGGMGSVYLATRVDDEYRKEVAVKIVRADVDDAESRRRFLVERQILANLDHPHIARLLDGGTTDDHTPYVVMEYVAGEPLTAFCDARRLTIEERLRLFARVCEAVQFAHRNLVVHRDLKPGNILVTADGTPKLLDFGIAKLLADPTGAPATRSALRPMTPEYASPEQVQGGAITTATDVYALGVLLCELLCGRRPYRLDDRSPLAVEAAITTQAPERPSTAVFRRSEPQDRAPEDQQTPEAVAAARGTTPERLRRQLAGDLDVITLMALRKEPERRYGSAEQLALDIRRHLDGLPVTARRDTVRYRAGKFVGRHRGAVAGTAAAVVLVAALTAFYGVRLARERDRAQAEGAKAAQVAEFLTELFRGADPEQAQGRDFTARELLATGARRVERELSGDPVLQATVMGVIGRVYQSLGDYPEATKFLEAAERQLRDVGAGGVERAVALHDLGSLASARGDHARAASLLAEAQALRRAHLPVPHADLVRTLALQGFNEIELGDFEKAEAVLGEAVTLGRQLPLTVGEAGAVWQALNNMGRLRSEQSRYRDAEPLLREALEVRRRVFGNDHPAVGTTLDQLAEVLRLDGKLPESEAMFREAIEHGRRILGDDHPTIANRLGNLANVVGNQGRPGEAIEINRDVLARKTRIYGPDSLGVAITLNNLATSHTGVGEFDEAERLLLESLRIRRTHFEGDHPGIATNLNNLAHVAAEKPDFKAAERYQQEALDMDRRLLGEDHRYVAMSMTLIGIFRLADGRVDEAEAPLRDGVALMRRVMGDDHLGVAPGLYGLGKYLAASGKFEEGEQVAREVIRMRKASLPEGHWEIALTETLLGEILAGQGRDAEAEPLLVNGFEIVSAQPIGSRNRTEARERVVRFFLSRGQPDRAARIRP
jgi:eukaryotic-like serine/threonine-protein kinase